MNVAFRTHLPPGATILSACACVLPLLPGGAWAIKPGAVLAIQSGQDQWIQGNLLLVNVPSNTKKTLISGSCGGPCFSPDARRIAVIQDGMIKTLNVDGSTIQTTGITVAINDGRGPCNHSQTGFTALYWLSLTDGEYLYWFDGNAPGTFRAKVGVWTKQKLNGATYFWGGFSRDGTRAAAAAAAGSLDCWNVMAIDLTTWQARQVHVEYGCNVSISPDGRYLWHLLNGGGRYGGAEHEYSLIRDWSTGDSARLVNSRCNHDTQRWSHFDNDILLYHNNNYHNGATCASDGNFGVVMDLSTRPRSTSASPN